MVLFAVGGTATRTQHYRPGDRLPMEAHHQVFIGHVGTMGSTYIPYSCPLGTHP